jgi:gamma-glutamyltranspeptidase
MQETIISLLNMKLITTSVFIALIKLPVCFTGFKADEIGWFASGNGGVVAAGPKASALAGIDILDKGGNAVDEAVATIFNLVVSDYRSFCVGGEVPFMFYDRRDSSIIVFNGMGSAPEDPGKDY